MMFYVVIIASFVTTVRLCPLSCICNEAAKSVDCSSQGLNLPKLSSLNISTDTKVLMLKNNTLTKFPVALVESLPQLKTIFLSKNFIQFLPKHVNNSNLKVVILDKNQVNEVFSDDLSGLTGLEELNLKHNSIKKLPANMFSDLKSLTNLELDNNEIENISPKSFSSLKTIVLIYLNDNKITKLSEDTFDNAKKLSVLNLSFNQLAEFPTGFNDVDDLNLSNNLLNKSQSTMKDDIVKKLDLTNNNITSLSHTWFSGKTSITFTDVMDNPITCDCNIVYLNKFVQHFRGVCSKPANLKGQQISEAIKSLVCDSCSINPCLHHGTCNVTVNNYTCTCVDPYKGINCETKLKGCELKPCQNNGTCIESNSTSAYACKCTSAFTGENCAEKFNKQLGGGLSTAWTVVIIIIVVLVIVALAAFAIKRNKQMGSKRSEKVPLNSESKV